MEICGAKLSQREALVFGVPGANVDNVRQALVRLQMDSAADCALSTVEMRAVVEKTMIWTELEACSRQVRKILVFVVSFKNDFFCRIATGLTNRNKRVRCDGCDKCAPSARLAAHDGDGGGAGKNSSLQYSNFQSS